VIVRGEILQIFNQMNAVELAMYMEIGGSVPVNISQRANRISAAGRVMSSAAVEFMPRPGASFESSQNRWLPGQPWESEKRRVA
jgi:hypothetical protein